jgi:hypothetical protein
MSGTTRFWHCTAHIDLIVFSCNYY